MPVPHLQNDQVPGLPVDGLLDHHLEKAVEVDDAVVLLAPAKVHTTRRRVLIGESLNLF